jgi:hypothetical protein
VPSGSTATATSPAHAIVGNESTWTNRRWEAEAEASWSRGKAMLFAVENIAPPGRRETLRTTHVIESLPKRSA